MATTNTLYKALAAAVAIFFAYYVSQGGVGNIANLSKFDLPILVTGRGDFLNTRRLMDGRTVGEECREAAEIRRCVPLQCLRSA